MIFQEGYRRLEDGGFIHFPVAGGDHGAELVHQHVELVSPLLLAQVTCPSKNKYIYVFKTPHTGSFILEPKI